MRRPPRRSEPKPKPKQAVARRRRKLRGTIERQRRDNRAFEAETERLAGSPEEQARARAVYRQNQRRLLAG